MIIQPVEHYCDKNGWHSAASKGVGTNSLSVGLPSRQKLTHAKQSKTDGVISSGKKIITSKRHLLSLFTSSSCDKYTWRGWSIACAREQGVDGNARDQCQCPLQSLFVFYFEPSFLT